MPPSEISRSLTAFFASFSSISSVTPCSTASSFRIKIASLDAKVSISVFNEGIGIAKEDIPLVFDRFYKSDKSRGMDKSGFGIGLYIAKTVIDAHGEKISVDSVEGESCEFSFTLKKSKK